jgi:hypothetical protein
MGVVRAKIQTVEDLYRLVWAAIASKRPIEARYRSPVSKPGIMDTLVYFVRIDWGGIEKGICGCCAINTAGKARADFQPAGSLSCVGEAQSREVAGGCLAHSTQPLPPCFLRDRCRN